MHISAENFGLGNKSISFSFDADFDYQRGLGVDHPKVFIKGPTMAVNYDQITWPYIRNWTIDFNQIRTQIRV